ncbi:MAG TPA: roadblock/LC7 domain-containing protein [Gemmatimonadaceae bacterium]|jgi:predicted regulator of Ras-like GTPase activity (Roadblock/LC7/MglB family)|nr:roadblock/LC7 domain-containing protein [Gemmatimonadaceae bacterium]
MSGSPFAEMLGALTRQRGVVASLVVDEHEGMIVDAILQFGQDGDRIAALAASLYRKARQSAHAAGLGGVHFLQMDAEQGRLCMAGRNALVLVVATSPNANVGLVRVEMLRAVEGLA